MVFSFTPLVLAWSMVLGTAGLSAGQAPTGPALLQHAHTLAAAGQYRAAETAYNQATAAFRRTGDRTGEQQALNQLEGMEEHLADQLLAGPAAPVRPLAPAGAEGRAAAPPRSLVHPQPAGVPRARPTEPGPAVAPVAGQVVGGRPVGLFFMTRFILAMNTLEKATYYFTPAGQVYTNPTDFTAAGLAALPGSSRGTFRVAGGQLAMSWAQGGTNQSKLENPRGTSFEWDAGVFVGMGPFANARQLIGTFEGGNSVSGVGAAAVSSGLQFRADGTFSTSTAATVSSTTRQSTVAAGSAGVGAGRWTLMGWTLALTDATGHVTRGLAYPIETDAKTGQVMGFYFNNVAYARR